MLCTVRLAQAETEILTREGRIAISPGMSID